MEKEARAAACVDARAKMWENLNTQQRRGVRGREAYMREMKEKSVT